MDWRRALFAASASLLIIAGPALADIKIGYLAALSGAQSDMTGMAALHAAQMAVDEVGGQVNGEKVTILSADYLGKPDVGLSIARQWLDEQHVNLLLQVDNSAVALAVSELVKQRNVVMLMAASNSQLINERCNAHQAMMLLDSTALARSAIIPAIKAGRKKWFFITVDYAFGHDLQAKATEAIRKAGGEVVGSAVHSPQTTDFSAFLLDAQAKGADTIALATFGAWQNTIAKQAQEFGIKAPLTPFYMAITDVKSAGLDTLQNVTGSIISYYDQNEGSRAFAKKFRAGFGRPPTFTNTYTYEFTRHYLRAIAATRSTDADVVMKWMRANAMELVNGSTATIREDGYTLRDVYSYRTKTPQESKGDWDYFAITGTVPAAEIAPPLDESGCPLVKK